MNKGPLFSLLAVRWVGCASNADVDLNAEITDRGTQISVLVESPWSLPKGR